VRLASEPVIESVDLPESARATGRFRYRLRYRKQDRAKWFGHLELAAVFARAVNRAKLRVLYSEGFHPQPRIVYGPPPPAGVASEDEWVEVTLAFAISPPEIIARLADVLPDGLIIEDVNEIAASMRGLADAIEGFTYEIDLRRVQAPVDVAARIKEFLARANYPVEVVKKSGLRTIDARALVLGAELIDDRVRLSVRHDPTGGLRPMALAAYLLGIEAADVPPTALVKRATRWKSGDLAGKG
jgi:radical SAM-linked protein